ncbi:MAG: FG-GAP-like repeat-containing protein [Acidobacteriota bacterium]|nr:FG-GAP-like repeat-containing protein [Acidobacteriota bacterium]
MSKKYPANIVAHTRRMFNLFRLFAAASLGLAVLAIYPFLTLAAPGYFDKIFGTGFNSAAANETTNNLAVGGGTGILEICVAASGPGLDDRVFRYRIGALIIQSPVGGCSGPIDLPAGPVTIEELLDGQTTSGGTFSGRFRLLNVTSNVAGSLGTVNLPQRTAQVTVREGSIQNQTVVTFTNTFAVNAVVEICKRAAANATNVTGFFNFTIDALPGVTFPTPVGACTGPIQVNVPTAPAAVPAPAIIRVTELSRTGFELQTADTFPADRFNALTLNQGISNTDGTTTFTNTGGGFAEVDVLEGGTASQTTVNLYNRAAPTVCSYSISPASVSIAALGGNGSIAVTTTTGCSWTASTASSWITIANPATGTDSGTLNYTVAANPGAARTGTITFEDNIFTIQQPALENSPYLDTTFGTGGKVRTAIGTVNELATDVALQSDGKIVAVGVNNDGNNGGGDFALVRYNANGSLDTTFGAGGKVTTSLSSGQDWAQVAAIQSDGKIVAAGYSSNNFALVRYNADGSIDNTFGAGGKVTTVIGTNRSFIYDILIQPDGKLVAAGWYDGPNISFAAARYNSDGSLDNTFGTGGKVASAISGYAHAAALQTDGKIVIVGESGQNATIARYNSNGSPDTTFGTNGIFLTPNPSGQSAVARSVVIQADGKIVVAGNKSGSSIDFYLARYAANGSLDTTFGSGGTIATPFGNNDFAFGAALQSDGKIIAAGYSNTNSSDATNDFALARYNSDGSLDTTFGSGGKILTPVGSLGDSGQAIAIQPDGKAIVAGYMNNGANQDFAVVRYAASQTPTTSETFTVTRSDDRNNPTCTPGDCSLREAINEANAAASDDIIDFAPGIPTITLTAANGGEMEITNAGTLTIIGRGADVMTIDGGAGTNRIFYTNQATVTILGLTLTGGEGNGPINTFAGGAVLAKGGGLTLERVRITGNSTPSGSGGGALFIGVGSAHSIINSTFSGNTAANCAGFLINDGTLTVVNSTISGNTASSIGGGFCNSGSTTLRHVTVTNNTANSSGGINQSFSTLNLGNSIVAGNTANSRPEIYIEGGTITSAGYNLIGDSSGDSTNTGSAIAYQSTDIRDVNPMLGSLQYTSSTTQTHTLLTGSPAIDKGSIFGATADQRGATRPFDNPSIPNAGDGSDIGAFEVQAATVSSVNVSIPTNLTVVRGSTLSVPVNVSDTTGKGITSFDFRLSYDPALFSSATPFVSTAGTLASGFEVNVSNPSAGTLIVSGFGSSPLASAGVLLNFPLSAISPNAACGSLGLSNFAFNEGNPAAATTGGNACVTVPAVSGTITYGSTATAVPGVTMTAVGTPSVATATTDASGNYSLSGFGTSSYTVTPSKVGGAGTGITSFDASQISKHLIQTVTLTAQQLAAADVSGNGTVTSFDASLIAQTVLGISNSGNAGTWKFTPVNRTYSNLTTTQSGQNYTAILLGDVSGNWTPAASSPASLKICKIAGSGVSQGTSFTFDITINGEPGISIAPVTVLAGPANQGGFCNFVDGPYAPSNGFGTFNVGQTVTVVERSVSGVTLSAVTSPTGTPTVNLAARSGMLALGSNVNELSFTNTATATPAPRAEGSTLVIKPEKAPEQIAEDGIAVSLPVKNAQVNSDFSIPVLVGDLTGGEISSFDFEVVYDSAVIEPMVQAVEKTNTLSGGFSVSANILAPGRLRVSGYGATNLSGSGTLVNLKFRAAGAIGTGTDLNWNGFLFNEGNPSVVRANGRVSIGSQTAGNKAPFDFDGDNKTDLSIFRPSVGEWWYLRSSDGGNRAFQFGAATDKIVSADYTGDGKTDIAFFRPSTGEWFVLRSEDGSYYSFPFGTTGDIPATADYDADGKADAAVFRPSTQTWFVLRSTGGVMIEQFGLNGDVPVVADYDGDNKADIAIYRPSKGEWWLNRSSAGNIAFKFGDSSDKPVQGDFTGDGKADVAFFRPSTNEWFVLRSENSSYYSFPFGANGDVATPGDYDGDGKTDAAVFRPSTNTWFAQRSTASTLIANFGSAGDTPVPSAFIP